MSRIAALDPYVLLLLRQLERHGECLLVPGKGNNGYMQIVHRKKHHLVHRISYEKWHGPIPEGFQIDHMCHNEAAEAGLCAGGPSCLHRGCVNPAHLRAVSRAENWRASPHNRRLGLDNHQSKKTHCPQGHEYSPENTFTYNGSRNCKECKRKRLNAWRRAKKVNHG